MNPDQWIKTRLETRDRGVYEEGGKWHVAFKGTAQQSKEIAVCDNVVDALKAYRKAVLDTWGEPMAYVPTEEEIEQRAPQQ